MLDFIKNRFKSEQDRRQEMISAYLDGSLSPKETADFEDELKRDEDLERDLNQYLWLQRSIGQLPRHKAPRNFTLDPAVYGKPASDFPVRLYPALRSATVLAGVAFAFLLGFYLISSDQGSSTGMTLTAGQEREMAADEIAVETIEEQESLSAAPAELPAEAPMAAEVAAEEEAVVEEAEVLSEAAPEAEKEEAAIEEEMEFPVEEESDESSVSGDGLARETSPAVSEPAEGEPVFSESEETTEVPATDVESGSVSPSPSESLSGEGQVFPLATQTIIPTSTFSESISEGAAGYPIGSDQPAELQLDDSAAGEGTIGAQAVDIIETAEVEEAPPIQEPAEDAAIDSSVSEGQASQRIGIDLQLLLVLFGLGLILLVVITLLVRSYVNSSSK